MEENILDILEKVNGCVDWHCYLDNIEEGMQDYQNAITNNQPNPEGHLNDILPTYWDVFHTHNIARRRQGLLPDSCYDVGIFLVGFSSIPIVLSIAEIQPRDRIYFLYSKDTEQKVDEIANRIQHMLCGNPILTGLVKEVAGTKIPSSPGTEEKEIIRLLQLSQKHPKGFALEINRPSDPVETFKVIKKITDQIGGNKQIALDLTGGKKTMIGGGFTAGAILGPANNIDMFYVDSLKYDPRRGAPEPGTEFLSLLENPYDVYNVQTVQRAEELFRKHNYEAAANLWEDIEHRLKSHVKLYSLEDEQKAVQSDLGMANCYRFWDAFDHKRAKNYKSFLFNGTRKGFWGYNNRHTHGEMDVLEILSQVSNWEKLFERKERVIHYAVDRYQSAVRRQESGKFDDAIIRFTQVIEMICSYKICRGIFIVAGAPIPPDFLREPGAVRTLIRFFFGNSPVYRPGLPQVNSDEFLEIAEYGYTHIDQITNLIDFRNKIAHFTNSIPDTTMREKTEELRELAWKFLEAFSCSYCSQGLSFEDLLDLHKFRPASLSPVEQLVEELNCLTCDQVDEAYATTQIYKEKLQSLGGNDQQMIAKALKAYWKRIGKWEGSSLSRTQKEKVQIVQSILE